MFGILKEEHKYNKQTNLKTKQKYFSSSNNDDKDEQRMKSSRGRSKKVN